MAPWAILRQLMWVLLLLGAWMTLVVTTALSDVALGAASAVLTALLVALIRRACGAALSIRAGWLITALPLLPRLFTDTATVFAALAGQLFRGRPVHGSFRAVRYAGIYRDEAEASGGDAFVIATNSLTPNSVILDVDRLDGLVLLHQLVPQDPARVSAQLVRPG